MSLRASSGLRAWLIQRCSAVYLAVFILYGMVAMANSGTIDFATWKAWVAHPVNNIAIALFFLALVLHAWVGSRDIIMDYIKPTGFRLLKLSGLALFLMAMAVWAMKVLIMATA